MDDIWLMLLLQLLLIGLNAIFACAEIAVITINENKLEKMAEDGNSKAIKLQKLKSEPARFLATIQVAITLSGFLGSAFAADNFSDRLVTWVTSLGINIAKETLDTVSVILITLILSYFTLILGELVPKRVAMRKAESLALSLSSLIYFISKIFKPIVSFLTFSTNSILKIIHIDPNATDDDVSEEDIRMMVDAGHKKGAIDNDEKILIQNIFEFDDLTAAEIATHRTDVKLLMLDETDEEWDLAIKIGGHGKYPVCDENADKIIGILNTKDYFRLDNPVRDNILEHAVKPAYFVPENVKADVLFKNMKQSQNYFAVVLDEHGGMTGIVTMADLIEQIVGDFESDKFSENDEEIKRIDIEGNICWKIKGTAYIDDVEKMLGVDLKTEDCDTFGGYVFSILGVVLPDGSNTEIESDVLHISETIIENHQLISAVVKIKP